jgi:hypothetical protein
MPATVATTIEKKFRFFMWSGKEKSKKVCNVSWATVTLLKSVSGLRVGSFRDKNKAMVFKWLWRFGSEESSMWKDVIKSIHKPNCSKLILQAHIPGAGTTWTRIVNHCVKDIGYRIL